MSLSSDASRRSKGRRGPTRPWRLDASEDVLALRADEEGRFRAHVLAGRTYSVWASTKTATGARITDLVAHARAGAPIRLREQEPFVAAKIRVDGFDAWRDKAELRFHVVVLGSSAVATGPLRLDDDGCFELPALPPGRTFLKIVDATGCVALPQTRLPATSVTLLSPLTVRYRVVDRDDARPVVNATLLRLDDVDRRWREIGKTDEKGSCTVLDAGPCDWGEAVFVHAAGYREVASVKAGTRGDDGNPITEVKLELVKAAPIRGRLFLSKDVAAKRIPLILGAAGVFENGYVGGNRRAISTTVDGSFALPRPGYLDEPGPLSQFSVFAALGPDEVELVDRETRDQGIDESKRSPLYPYVPLVFQTLSKDPEPGIDLGTVCISDCTRVDLTATTTDRRPARFASVYLNVMDAGNGDAAWLPASAVTDSRGRLSILLPPKRWIVGVSGNRETFVSDLDLSAAEKSQRIALRCDLQAPRLVTGIVFDADEEPVANAVVRWQRKSTDARYGLGHVLEAMGRIVRSDAAGRFRLAVPRACEGCSVSASLGDRYTIPIDVDLKPDAGDLRLVLQKGG